MAAPVAPAVDLEVILAADLEAPPVVAPVVVAVVLPTVYASALINRRLSDFPLATKQKPTWPRNHAGLCGGP